MCHHRHRPQQGGGRRAGPGGVGAGLNEGTLRRPSSPSSRRTTPATSEPRRVPGGVGVEAVCGRAEHVGVGTRRRPRRRPRARLPVTGSPTYVQGWRRPSSSRPRPGRPAGGAGPRRSAASTTSSWSTSGIRCAARRRSPAQALRRGRSRPRDPEGRGGAGDARPGEHNRLARPSSTRYGRALRLDQRAYQFKPAIWSPRLRPCATTGPVQRELRSGRRGWDERLGMRVLVVEACATAPRETPARPANQQAPLVSCLSASLGGHRGP